MRSAYVKLFLTTISVFSLLEIFNLNDVHRFSINNTRNSKSPDSHTRKKILVVTEYRSGSTFLSQLFNKHNNSFYLFEPLIISPENDDEQMSKLLHQYFENCSIPTLHNQPAGYAKKYLQLAPMAPIQRIFCALCN